VALVVGTLLAVGALAFVLYPLFFGVQSSRAAAHQIARSDGPSLEHDVAVAALREIEFDRATGKLSDADYAQLKERYMGDALAVLRRSTTARGDASSATVDDEIERAVRSYREHHPDCLTCGPRPEPDAIYCSTCGRYLRGSCLQCGSRIDEVGARFCRSCGHELAVNAA
jgi:hypothetical protein